MPKLKLNITRLHNLGFDRSYRIGTGRYEVKCSQCEALVINGTPCHERGCPNSRKVEGKFDAD